MAYLGNTLINGSLRCLNKAYFEDLSVSGTTSFANLDVSGKTTTNQLVVNNSNNPSTLSSTNSSTGNIPVVIGNPNGKHIAIDGDEIAAKNGATTASDMWLNYGGGAVYLGSGGLTYLRNNVFVAPTLNSTTSTITTGNITTLNASTATADNLTVNNVLKSFKWDISNVANLANDFMVAPTIEIATDGTVSVSKSGSDYIFTFADSNTITSDEFAGCKWLDGSKVRFTTKINDKLFSDVYGTVTGNMNTNSGRLAVKTSLTDNDLTGISMNTSYDAVGSTIMLYAITKTDDANIYPVGIHMTAYGTNNSYYIDMYGGNSPSSSGTPAQPVFRIGNLGGITYNEQTLPAQWGVYTYNGYFEGAVVANEGKIANFTIASDKLYTGTHSTWNANEDGIFINNTYISFGKQALTYFKNDGTGKIGNWKIDSISLYNGTFGTADSAMVCTGSSTAKAIGGSESISGWTFTSGANFGVTKTGALYASDVNISGAVNATALHVGSSSSTNHLIYENSTIDLQTDWLKFDDGVVTIGQDNNSQIFLDGQSIDLKDENGLTYFYVGDKRINGVYTFTMEHPYIVTNNYKSHSIGVDYVIDSNYPVSVFDEENNEIPIDRIYSLQIVSDSYTFLVGKVYKILFTTSSPIYNFSYVQKPDFIGSNAVVFAKRGKSYGTNSFTEGMDTTASGRASHAEGEDTTASGSRSHAEGLYTTASGNYGSHAEGNNTVASGDWGSHAEGEDTTASGVRSHAEGDGTTASGNYGSHAEGDGTTASGYWGSHAEGDGTVASGPSSHSEGYHTIASGDHSHAEGMYTTASGDYGSHAEGCNTVASGKGSHASGQATYATRDYQTVIGKYNSVTTSTDSEGNTVYDAGNYAFVIGNGDTSTRSNALTVDWNGNVNNVDLHCISTEGIKVTHDYQTAIGKYNEIKTSVDETDGFIFDSGNYAFIIGNGTSDSNRSNALTVGWNGNLNCAGSITSAAGSSTRFTFSSSVSGASSVLAYGYKDNVAKTVRIYFTARFSSNVGTSTSMFSVPAAYRPAVNNGAPCIVNTDTGAAVAGYATIGTDGTVKQGLTGYCRGISGFAEYQI